MTPLRQHERCTFYLHPLILRGEGEATGKLSLVVSTSSFLEDPRISSADHEAVNTHNLEYQDLYGLPPGMSKEEYELDPVCLLSKYNYKVEAKIGRSTERQRDNLCVLDSGAGPNLIRAGLVAPQNKSRIVRNKDLLPG